MQDPNYLCYILQPMVGDDPVPRVLQHVPWLGEAPSTQAGALVQALRLAVESGSFWK
jgi:hypothetical protein